MIRPQTLSSALLLASTFALPLTAFAQSTEDAAATTTTEISARNAQIEALLDAAKSDTVTTRREAVATLAALGSDSDPRIESALSTATGDSDAAVRQTALDALAQAATPRRYDVLIDALRYRSPIEQAIALRGLRTDCPVCVAELTAALNDPDVCCQAAGLLGEIGPAATSAVPALTAHLNDNTTESARVETLIALASIGAGSSTAAGEIVTQLSSSSPAVMAAAAHAAGEIGVSEAVPTLRQLVVQQRDATVRLSAAKSLAQLSFAPKDHNLAVTAVTDALQQDDELTVDVGTQVAVQLAAVTDRIVNALFHGALAADSAETQALVAIGPAATLNIAHRLRVDRTRPAALAVVEQLGPEARLAVPTLLRLLRDNEVTNKVDVVNALAAASTRENGRTDAVVIHQLRRLQEHGSADVGSAASKALGDLAPHLATDTEPRETLAKALAKANDNLK